MDGTNERVTYVELPINMESVAVLDPMDQYDLSFLMLKLLESPLTSPSLLALTQLRKSNSGFACRHGLEQRSNLIVTTA